MTKETLDLIRSKYERQFNTNETMAVLRQNLGIFWSWGATGFTNCEDKGLLFKSNGRHHKGYVLITLAWDDTYSVYIITTHGNVLNEYKMVYFEDLVEVIDNRIERIAAYVR